MIKATCILITTKKTYPIIQDYDFDEVIVRTECPNILQRYLEAEKARNDIIYVQDDDCIVDYKELFTYYDGKITNTITRHHRDFYRDTGITLVGWGCYFPKSMLGVFAKYIDKYGMDDHLLREADRVFTYLNQPHNTILMPHQDVNQDYRRMSHDPDHYGSLWRMLEKLKAL